MEKYLLYFRCAICSCFCFDSDFLDIIPAITEAIREATAMILQKIYELQWYRT